MHIGVQGVSQVGVHYRGRALSQGATEFIEGGDRLPWVPMDAEEGNFAPLTALEWQVHVYGEARGGLAEACAELGLSLHQFPWSAAAHDAGLERAALYLLRPDGYIALADPPADAAVLRKYFVKRGFRLPLRNSA